jgi:hypothetical protein
MEERSLKTILREAEVGENGMIQRRFRLSTCLCHGGWGNERQKGCADREFAGQLLKHDVSPQ